MRRTIDEHRAIARLGRQPHDEENQKDERPVGDDRGADGAAKTLFLLFELEMDFGRTSGGVDIKVSLGRSAFRRARRRCRWHCGGVCLAHCPRACLGPQLQNWYLSKATESCQLPLRMRARCLWPALMPLIYVT